MPFEYRTNGHHLFFFFKLVASGGLYSLIYWQLCLNIVIALPPKPPWLDPSFFLMYQSGIGMAVLYIGLNTQTVHLNTKQDPDCILTSFRNKFSELGDELTIRSGEIIKDVKRMSGGWWEGSLKGKRGLFPDNFVKVGHLLLKHFRVLGVQYSDPHFKLKNSWTEVKL